MARPTHGYTLRDGTPVPGVTTIIGQLDKPALVGWAGKKVAEFAVEHGKQCYAAGQAGTRAPAFPRWNDILYRQRDQAAEDGTTAHDLFERHLRGEKVWRKDETDAAWLAFENAKHWLSSSGLDVDAHETPLVSECFGYGGTPDAIARQGDVVCLADWKTGGVYESHIIQMAAYAALLKECQGIAIDGVHLVRFSREHGDFTHHFWSRDLLVDGWRVFEHLLGIWEPLRHLKMRCK